MKPSSLQQRMALAAVGVGIGFSVLGAGFPNQAWSADWIEPDWSESARVPSGGRANLYQLPEEHFRQVVQRGRQHAIEYPVVPTGILLPWQEFRDFLNGKNPNPLRRFLGQIFKGLGRFESADDVFRWLGLHEYPAVESLDPIYGIPFPQGADPDLRSRPPYRVGVTLRERHGVEGFTLGCATCHSSQLFGRVVLGMSNRFPRANEFFEAGVTGTDKLNASAFQWLTGASDSEKQLYEETRRAIRAVGVKKPIALGLDTSLAQVALSLNRRNPDAEASRSTRYEAQPRKDILDTTPADSKPAVWWNLKYKSRWLSDGSVLSGNPIFTNFIWNEIGRGVDLPALEQWLNANQTTVRELTAAVFATEAPRFTDFFPAESIDLRAAKRGQSVFEDYCVRCHGSYQKGWNQLGGDALPLNEQLRTVFVDYFEQTPIKDVGTDPYRGRGMKSLEEKLNPLRISKANQIRIETQVGYVPPPLVGIWARWPYLHNNSVPTLCDLLTRSEKRPVRYLAREANDPNQDFDLDCVGYPRVSEFPKDSERVFDTRKTGLSNAGHDEGIFLEKGKELLSVEQKRDLIEFLKTL